MMLYMMLSISNTRYGYDRVAVGALQLKVLYCRHLYRGTEGGGGVDRIKPIPRELMHIKIPVSLSVIPKGVFIRLKLMRTNLY